MDWLETWRDSWSTGSATASSSSSSGGNANDDTRAAATDNAAAAGKKRKQELATAATPSDEPRRTKRARKPTAALAEFRIELDSRQDRNDANDFEQPRVTRKRVRVESVEDAASSLELRKRGGNVLWSSEEDARLRTAVLTFTGKDPTTTTTSTTNTNSERIKLSPPEWLKVKQIFDALAPPPPSNLLETSSTNTTRHRSADSLRARFQSALSSSSPHLQRAAISIATPPAAAEAVPPSPSGSQRLLAEVISQRRATRSVPTVVELERPMRANPSKGLGGGTSFKTSEIGNGTQEGEDTTAGSSQPPMRAGKVLWTPTEDARLRSAVLTLAGNPSATTNNTLGHTKITVKPVEWPEVKRIFDGLAPPGPGVTPAPSRSERSLQHRFDAVLSPLYQHAAPLTAPVAEAPSSRGSQRLVSPAPSLDASSATPAAINAGAVSHHADRSATLLAELKRGSKATASKGLGDVGGFGTSEIGNGTQQDEDTTARALKPQPQRRKDLWSAAEDARLRTALFTFAGLDPTTTSISIDRVKVKTVEWHEVKRIFDALAPPNSASSGPPPPRSVHSLQAHFHTVLLSPRRQQAPPVTVPAEAGPSPSGSQWVVSSTPSSSAAAIPSGFAGTNVVEEDSQRADLSAKNSGEDERREESAPPNQAAAVASFDTAAATAFFPGSDDPMNGSPTLTNAPAASIPSGSATAPAIMSSQNSAAAPAINLDSSTPRPEGSNTSHHQAESQLLSGPTRDVQGPAGSEKGASIGRPVEPNPPSGARRTPNAGTSGAVATSSTPSGNVNSTSSAPAGSGTQPAGSGGKTSGPFTAAEDARIIELFGLKMPQTHIAKALNRGSNSVHARVGILRQHGLIPPPPPRKQPALGASDRSTETSPATVTQNAQQTVASSSHSTLVPAASSSTAVPSSQAPLHDPQVGPSTADATPSAPQSSSNPKVATRTFHGRGRSTNCRAQSERDGVAGDRIPPPAGGDDLHTLLKEKAQLAGKDLSSYVQQPKPAAAGGQEAGQAAFSTPPSISSTPAQQPAATTAPLPPYTVEDDTIILRMYLQGNSAERIGTAIKRSAFSVHRRWNKKKDGWIAAGLLTSGSRLKLHDDPLDQPVVSAATKSPVDPFGDLRAPPTSATSVQQDAHEPIGSPSSCTPTLEPETTENDLDGFDASFFSYEDMVVDPALLGIRAEPMSDAAREATTLQPQNPAAATLGSREESALVPSASEDDSSMPETTTEKMLAGAMPHYDSGMQGLDRFLRLVKDGGKKKR